MSYFHAKYSLQTECFDTIKLALMTWFPPKTLLSEMSSFCVTTVLNFSWISASLSTIFVEQLMTIWCHSYFLSKFVVNVAQPITTLSLAIARIVIVDESVKTSSNKSLKKHKLYKYNYTTNLLTTTSTIGTQFQNQMPVS